MMKQQISPVVCPHSLGYVLINLWIMGFQIFHNKVGCNDLLPAVDLVKQSKIMWRTNPGLMNLKSAGC